MTLLSRIILLLIPLIAAACSAPRSTDVDPADYSAGFYTPRHAAGFAIKSAAADSTRLMLEVYRPDTMRIAIPQGGFRRIVCMSSTNVGMLSAIGRSDRVVGVSGRQYLTNAEVRARAAEVGYEGAMDYESLLAVQPDIVLIYGIGGESQLAAKLSELGVTYLYISDFKEQSPLARAEWTVALGALAGADARDYMARVEAAYQPAEPSVPVMLNAPYGGSWFIPGTDSYMSRLISDAGGHLTAPQHPGTDSRPIDIETAVPALDAASIWLNPGQVTDAASARRLASHARFGGEIWNQTPDFYESGAAHPDAVVSELQQIFAGNADSGTTLRYFTRLR